MLTRKKLKAYLIHSETEASGQGPASKGQCYGGGPVHFVSVSVKWWGGAVGAPGYAAREDGFEQARDS